MPEPERSCAPNSNTETGMIEQKANTETSASDKGVPQQREECHSLKNVDGDGDDDDPNRHLAKVEIPRVCVCARRVSSAFLMIGNCR